MANKIQFKRGLKAQLPTLALGEPALCTDTQEVFVGTGSGNVQLGKQTDVANKVDKVAGKQLSTNDYTTAEKNKLANIAAGAQVNTVTSVAGKTGAVTLGKGDVGLSNVDNTSDAAKPISTATQAALNTKASSTDLTSLQTIVNQHLAQSASYDEYTLPLNQSIANDILSTLQLSTKSTHGISVSTLEANNIFKLTDAGTYEIIVSVAFGIVQTSTLRQVILQTVFGTEFNGANIVALSVIGDGTVINFTVLISVAAGTTFRVMAKHQHGSALNVLSSKSTVLKIRKVG